MREHHKCVKLPQLQARCLDLRTQVSLLTCCDGFGSSAWVRQGHKLCPSASRHVELGRGVKQAAFVAVSSEHVDGPLAAAADSSSNRRVHSKMSPLDVRRCQYDHYSRYLNLPTL